METKISIKQAPSSIHWVSFIDEMCPDCGWRMQYRYHGNPRELHDRGNIIKVVMSYYICPNADCANKKQVVARHPEILYKKKYSKSTFTEVIKLRYDKKYSIDQILDLMPYLTKSTIYEIIRSYRAVRRAGADKRIANKYPPGTKITVSIDGMEPEKGQPSLYTVRESSKGDLLTAGFIEFADNKALYELVSEIETKYGLIIAGFISDKQRSIIAMHKNYYSKVPMQYCTVHYMKNVTKELRAKDTTLQKNLRSEIRQLAVFKTIQAKDPKNNKKIDEVEINILKETRTALLALVNMKKKEMFDLAGIRLYQNMVEASVYLSDLLNSGELLSTSQKFQILLKHISEKMEKIILKYKDIYDILSSADDLIHPMFHAIFKSHPKHPKRAFKNVVKLWIKIIDDPSTPDELRGLMEQALKFAKSYEKGLFVWRKANLPYHNNSTESFYNEKKGNYRQNSRNKKIGITLQLSGLEEMYIPSELTEDEIMDDLEEFGTLKYWAIREEMKQRSVRRKYSRRCQTNIVDVLKEIFKKLEKN